MPPPILQAHLKRLQGVMLISVCQGSFNGASAFLWHCSSNCKLHTDEGRVCLPFLLSKAFARSFAVVAVIAARCKGCAFCRRSLLLFARGCACVRLHAVFGCLFAVCAAFSAFAILCPPCALSRVLWLVLQPRLQPLLCALRSEIQRLGGAKMGGGQRGDKPPASVGAFIGCGVLPRPAAVFPLLNNCGRRRGRCFWGLLRRLQYTPQQIARRTMHSSHSCCCVCPCIVRSCGLRSL